MQRIKEKFYKLLHWSEKYTKTDMVYLTHGGFWLTLGQIVSSISSFLLAIAFANLLPRETFGVYKYILSVCGILAIPTLGGINTAVTQAVARGYEGSLVPALKTKIKWGLLGGLASLILAGYYYFQGNIILTISFLVAAIFLPLMDPFGIYDSLLQGRKLFNISSKYVIISQIISVIALIITIFLTKNIFLVLLAYFLSWTLLRFIFWKITLKKFPPNQNQGLKTISYGKHLSLIGVINAIALYLDRLLLFHFFGAIEVAIYSFAIAPPEQIKIFFKNISSLALPKFSERKKEDLKKTMFHKVFVLGIIITLVVFVYLLLAPLVYKIFFPKYIESIFYSQIYAISIIAITLLYLPFSALQAQVATKELYFLNFWNSLVQIILLIIFIYFWGILGAVISRVISRFLNLIFSFILLKRI